MNKEKPYFLKRVIAYIVDFLIITLLVGILSTVFIKNDSYHDESRKLLQLYESYSTGNITRDEFNNEYENTYYYLTKDSVGITIINISISLIYFVGLCYYCGGVTPGKRLVNLKISGANDKKLHLGHYLIRGLLINLILSNIVNVMMVLLLNKETFILIHSKSSSVLTIFILVTLVFMMYRDDGRGLHDVLAGTKVVSTKKEKEEVKEDVVEAKVVEEKKTKKKSTKKDVK